jgi:hypothetical protein
MTQIPAGRVPSQEPTGAPGYDLLPMLSRGRHLDPADGGCVMEMASLLAGERWSDAPKCTHPLLAAVARLVNDELEDDKRQRLLPLVPDLVGATGPGSGTAPAIVRACARTALTVDPRSRRLRSALVRANDRLTGPPTGHWRDVVYTYGAATHAVVRAIDTIVRRDTDCDETLTRLLRECIEVVRERTPNLVREPAVTETARAAVESVTPVA